jgi:hypothetical protein
MDTQESQTGEELSSWFWQLAGGTLRGPMVCTP